MIQLSLCMYISSDQPKGRSPEKKIHSFGHCPNERGEGPCPNIQKKIAQFARIEGKGGGGNLGNVQKNAFLLRKPSLNAL